MTPFLTGKGMYIWKIKDVEGGDGVQAATVAFNAGLTHVLIKILDGPWAYNQRPVYGSSGQLKGYEDDIIEPFIEPFLANGIEVWGWQYVYHKYPEQEAEAANERVQKLGLNGFVIDAEIQAKENSRFAGVYARTLNMNVPIALSTYRYPKVHPEINYNAYFGACDLVMPQVYWEKSTNSGEQLILSLNQYLDITDLPYYPTGSAYCERGWCATPAQVKKFMLTAQELDMPAVNFWRWVHAREIPGMWDTISQFEYSEPIEPEPEPEPEPADKMVIGLKAVYGDKTFTGSVVLNETD